MAEVRLEGLTKRYDGSGEPAVADITFRIEDNEFMVLLGPSGCGKSTILRMVAGLEVITGGTLYIDGKVMNRVPAKDRDIAMVFQSYALYPHMKVRENLAFGLKRRGFPKPEIARRVAEVAEILGLTPYLDRKPHALSGGQRQRVALGRAIIRQPKVFLFDEPLSNLDAALRVSTRNELIKLYHQLRATIIYVTHDQVEAMTMGTRICIVDKGRVMQIGPPMEVYRRPLNTFVASFLGSPPMNLFPAELEPVESSGCRLHIGRQTFSVPAEWASACPGGRRAVVFGIRPEDVLLPDAPLPPASTIRPKGVVGAVEPLGAETLVTFEIEGIDRIFMARTGRECGVRNGQKIDFLFNLAESHLFDPETGMVITGHRDRGET